MAAFFYLVLVAVSKDVNFGWWWLLVACLFSGHEAQTVYRYTADPKLDGKHVD